MRQHSRVVVSNSSLFDGVFGDFYGHAPSPLSRPMVCWWGGAISAHEYERRRSGPWPIVWHEFQHAAGDSAAADLLVLSVPPVEPCSRAELRGRLLRTFFHELLPATPNPEPSAIMYVGYSVGAYLSTVLALERADARGVATLGGVGMALALDEARSRPTDALRWATFVNDDDPCVDDTRAFRYALTSQGSRVTVYRAAGGHDLVDYIANGSLRAAFRFAIADCHSGVARPHGEMDDSGRFPVNSTISRQTAGVRSECARRRRRPL